MSSRRQYTFDDLSAGWESAMRFVDACRDHAPPVGPDADRAQGALKTLFVQTVRLSARSDT